MNPPLAKQIVVIDVLRFFAAAGVMFFHLGYLITQSSTPWAISNGAVKRPWAPGLSWYGWIGVEIFFVISGIVISYSSRNATALGFTRSRVLRLVPAAWICATLTLVLLLAHRGTTSTTWSSYAASMLFLPAGPYIDGAYWTLAIECMFYLCVGVLIYRDRLGAITKLAQAMVLLSSAYWLVYTGSHYSHRGVEFFENPYATRAAQVLLLAHGSFFALGVFISKVLVERSLKVATPWWLLTIGVCLVEIYSANRFGTRYMNQGASSIPALILWSGAMVLLVIGIRYNHTLSKNARTVAILRLLGLMTYPLYLLHQNIGAVITSQLMQRGEGEDLARLGAIVGIMLTAYAVTRYLEPALRTQIARALNQVRPSEISRA